MPTVIRMLGHAAADVGASQRVIIMMTGPLMAVTKIAIGHCTSQAPVCSYCFANSFNPIPACPSGPRSNCDALGLFW